MGWGFQDFAAGVIAGVNVTLTANENGSYVSFHPERVIDDSAVIVQADNPGQGVYTGTTRLFSTKVTVSAHTSDSVTLSGVPHTDWGACRIYYFYNYEFGAPLGYKVPPRVVAEGLFTEIQNLFVSEEEVVSGYVPYTGANANVDLGAYDFSATDGIFSGTVTVGGDVTAGGNIIAAVGAAATPSIYFGTNSDTGMYYIHSDMIGFAIGGNLTSRLDSYGIMIIDGVANAPSYSFLNDDNSGFYSIGADNIGLALNGIKRVDFAVAGITVTGNIIATGDVGIGTSSPQKDLHIQSTVPTIRMSDSNAGTDQAVATLIEFYRANNTNRVGFLGMESSTNNILKIGTDYPAGQIILATGSNVNALTIDSSQNVDFQGNLTTTRTLIVGSAEKITNGDFADDSVWDWGATWSWDGGNEEADCDPGGSDLTHTFTPITGYIYRVIFTVDKYMSGAVRFSFGGVNGTSRSDDGTYTELATARSTLAFKFVADADFEGSIDDVSVKVVGSAEVTGDLTVIGDLTDGTNELTVANAKAAYDHSIDNSQAHTDYLLNTSDQMDGNLTIDNTGTEALLVRQNADAADVFAIDTTNGRASLYQQADGGALGGASNEGLRVFGFDDKVGDYVQLVVQSDGRSALRSSGFIYITPDDTGIGYFSANFFSFYDNKSFRFGNSSSDHGLLMFGTAQTNNALILGLPCPAGGSQSLIVCSNYDKAYNFAHADQTNPTIFIHSDDQTTDEWMSLTHNATDGVIDCGAGTLNLGGTANVNFAGATYTADGPAATGYVTMEVAGISYRFLVATEP